MDVHIAEKYKDVMFDDLILDLICELVKKDSDIIKVLQLFIENEISRIKELTTEGITKKQIMELTVLSKKLDKKSNTFIIAEIKITKPRCNNIISFLTGATLIYYQNNDRAREKPYFLTKRGVQLSNKLMKLGILSKPNLKTEV